MAALDKFRRICRYLNHDDIQTLYAYATMGVGVPGEYRPGVYSTVVEAFATHGGGIPLTEEATFLDIGSGTGKAVFAAALLGPFETAIGIEIAPGLAKVATRTAERFDVPGVHFYEGDATCSLPDDAKLATHVYIQSLGMPPSTLGGLARVLANPTLPWKLLLTSHPAETWRACGLQEVYPIRTIVGLASFGAGEQRRLYLVGRQKLTYVHM